MGITAWVMRQLKGMEKTTEYQGRRMTDLNLLTNIRG
jgi:hypothetical protein